MKKNNIDKIFQKKLLEKETLPSRHAWSKLENKLHHKRKKFILFRYAAAITLVLLTSLGILLHKSEVLFPGGHSDKGNDPIQIMAQDFPLQKEAEIMVDTLKSGKSEENLIVTIESKVEEKIKEPELYEKSINQTKESLVNEKKTNSLITIELPDIQTDQSILVSDGENNGSKVIPEITEGINVYPTITITFVRGASSATNEITMITNEKEPVEQESKLKKLIQSAKDLKLSDVNLAEIRETKDELFNLKSKL